MFTGIIEEVGSIRAVQQTGGLVRLRIRGPQVTQDAGHGDSIAVNGVCLTVADPGPDPGPDEFTGAQPDHARCVTLRQGRSTPMGSHLATGSRDFLFLLASARKGGSTEALARQAAAGLPPEDTQQWLHLADLPLPPCNDTRNDRDHGYRAPIGHENTLLQATLRASDLVIASPLYWYSLSASAKLYLDYWSEWLRLPGIGFAGCMGGKTLWTITALSDTDPAAAQPMVDMLRLTADYLGMYWGDALLATGCHSARAPSGRDRTREFFSRRSEGLSH